MALLRPTVRLRYAPDPNYEKKIPVAYFFLFLLLLTLLSLPKEAAERIRGSAVAIAAPAWKQLAQIRGWFVSSPKERVPPTSEELQKLQIENRLLRNELVQIKESMHREWRLLSQLPANYNSQGNSQGDYGLKKRHQIQIKKIVDLQLQATPAKVIFRSLASWNSSLWINLGESANLLYGKKVIAKNSPVVVGSSVIGVVDYVGQNQSRIRLITDSGLTPSVRVKREREENQLLQEKIAQLLQLLEKIKEQIDGPYQWEGLTAALESALSDLPNEENEIYLAKGEIQGMSKPLWRTSRHLLKGHGFNYDYADGEGPARDLHTGTPIGNEKKGNENKFAALPILQTGDLLVTTGMDGVFPAGLLVAQVSSVSPLKEGDYFYELEGIPTAGNLDELTVVFVLPPSEYDPHDQPQRF